MEAGKFLIEVLVYGIIIGLFLYRIITYFYRLNKLKKHKAAREAAKEEADRKAEEESKMI